MKASTLTLRQNKGFRLWLLDFSRSCKNALVKSVRRYRVWCAQVDKADNPSQL